MDKRIGNKYWQFREKHGRDYKYTPEALWEEAVKYFEWVEANPLWESIVIQRGIKIKDEDDNEKTVYTTSAPKMRAMTITAFCLFADISFKTFENYDKEKDFIHITTHIRDIIYSQKFEGASASLLNPNIIARDLGLSERTVSANVNYNSEPLSKDKIKEINKALEDEY